MTGFVSPLLMPSWSKFLLCTIRSRDWSDLGVIMSPSYLANIVYFNEFSVESIFNWNKFDGGGWGRGGGGGGYTCNIYIFYVNVRKLCLLVPFNNDETKFRTKLTGLLQMNFKTSRIPPSIMLSVLSFSV